MSGARGLFGAGALEGLLGDAGPLALCGVSAVDRAAAEAMGEKLTALSIRGELGREGLSVIVFVSGCNTGHLCG